VVEEPPARVERNPGKNKLRLELIPCEKGADSVDFGIKHVQGFLISYTKRSENIKKEYENYAWLVNNGVARPLYVSQGIRSADR
jgi:hypothetical protein